MGRCIERIDRRLLSIGRHLPSSGRIEAFNNNLETQQRRVRGCRDHRHFLFNLRFATPPFRSP
ncbi:transposase [Vulgatibacter incomptus]|uniref:transposase n=1 Tax=Vulgatibacter incomptus TaxID=1391653 RepID=UPI0012FB4822